MKIVARILALSLSLLAPAAFAQPADAKKAAPPADAAMQMPMPTRDAALDHYNGMAGTWRCEGKMMMMGKEMPTKGTAKFAWDLDKYWMVGKFTSPKTKESPGYKGTAYYGYDAAAKMYVTYSFDNMGGWGMATSKGQQGDTEEWAGKGQMMGQMMDMKTTIKNVSPKEVQMKSTMGQMSEESTCKK